MEKQIVGRIIKPGDIIQFFNIVKSYNNLTVIRRSGSEDYYLYKEDGAISVQHFPTMGELLECKNIKWSYNVLFFWADSKFVTEYHSPNRKALIDLYYNLLAVKHRDVEFREVVEDCKSRGWFEYMYTLFYYRRMQRRQNRDIRKVVKEFKVIWHS